MTYGFADDADVRADEVESRGLDGMAFRLRTPAGDRAVEIRALGRLAVHNALAGAAAGLAAGISLDDVVPGLAAPSRAAHRSTVIRAGGVVIVDDSYNASPALGHRRARAPRRGPGRPPDRRAGRDARARRRARRGPPRGRRGRRRALDPLVVVDGEAGGAARGIVDGALAAGLPAGSITAVATAEDAVARSRDDRSGPATSCSSRRRAA